jgi:Protein of unknown function (DUF3109)
LDPLSHQQELVVRAHKLSHIPRLLVDPQLFAARFSQTCSMSSCDAGCCRDGVYVAVEHRDLILTHADVVQRHMSPEQEHDPERWFEREIVDDPDFPSGKAVGTEQVGSSCVFLNRDRRCVLHAVDDSEHLTVTLKPFFCRAFPVTICNGLLTLDEPVAGERPGCCSETAGGSQTVLGLCRSELETVLGNEGVEELMMIESIQHE